MAAPDEPESGEHVAGGEIPLGPADSEPDSEPGESSPTIEGSRSDASGADDVGPDAPDPGDAPGDAPEPDALASDGVPTASEWADTLPHVEDPAASSPGADADEAVREEAAPGAAGPEDAALEGEVLTTFAAWTSPPPSSESAGSFAGLDFSSASRVPVGRAGRRGRLIVIVSACAALAVGSMVALLSLLSAGVHVGRPSAATTPPSDLAVIAPVGSSTPSANPFAPPYFGSPATDTSTWTPSPSAPAFSQPAVVPAGTSTSTNAAPVPSFVRTIAPPIITITPVQPVPIPTTTVSPPTPLPTPTPTCTPVIRSTGLGHPCPLGIVPTPTTAENTQ